MRVTFPFLYSATSIQNGQPVVGYKGEWGDLDLPDASDAPKVCDVEGYTPEGIPYLIEVRKLDGQFYRPKLAIRSNYFPIDDGSDRVNLRKIGDLVPSFFLGNGAGQTPIADRRDQIVRYIESDENARATVTDEKERVLETIGAALANLVIVNGEVWEPCVEPKLSANIFFSPPEVSVAFEPEGQRTQHGITSIMPLDQIHSFLCLLEEASAADALRVGQRQGGPDRKTWTVKELQLPSIEVLDDTLLSDPTQQALEAAKLSLSDILGRAGLQNFKRPFIIEWLDFRDAIDKATNDPSENNMEGMFYHWHHATELLEKSLAEEVPPGYYSASEGVGYRIRSRREAEAYREGFWRVHDCPAAAMVEKNHNLPG